MPETNKIHYLLNIISNYSMTIVASICGFIVAPLALGYFGDAKFGIWAIIMSFSAYLSISGLGVDAACAMLMTKSKYFSDKIKIFKNSLFLIIISIFFILIILFCFTFFYSNWYSIFSNMDNDLIPIVKKSAIIFTLFFLLNFPFSVIAYSFAAFQKTYVNNFLSIFYNLQNLIILLYVINKKLTLSQYFLLIGIFYFLLNLIKTFTWIYIVKKYKCSHNNIITNDYNLETTKKHIFKTGIRMSMVGITLMITPSITNLLVSNNLSVSSVTPYSLHYKLFFIAFTFVTAINLSAAPIYGKELANNNWDWLKKAYRRFGYLTTIAGGAIWLGGVCFLKDIMYLWIGSNKYSYYFLTLFLGIYIFFYSLSNLYYVIINSLNYVKGLWVATWFELLLLVVFSNILLNKIGLSGIALSLLLSSFLISQWVLPTIIYKRSLYKLLIDYKFVVSIFLLLLLNSVISYYTFHKIHFLYYRLGIGVIQLTLYIIISFSIVPKTIKNELVSLIIRKIR